jgi:hypothetical protein
VGSGYNVITGNPLVSVSDPGFAQTIFQFSYRQKMTTEDGKYLIPDEISHRKSSSCSLASTTSAYNSGESYKK